MLARDLSIPVNENGISLPHAWAGGMSSTQFSSIDWNFDGVEDLLIFDRYGNVTIPFVNNNIEGQSSYSFAPEYAKVWPFPELTNWVLMRDFNCDGKADIFASTVGGIRVFRNISSGGELAFELATMNPPFLTSNFMPTVTNIFVSSVDIPAISDVDSDGDLDILTFSIFGSQLEYHKNLSVEQGFGLDSLIFEVRNHCWGQFLENANDNSVTLDHFCLNVPTPEIFNGQEAQEAGALHSGSSVNALDLNGDKVTDLLLGDISFNNLVALFNDGTQTSSHIATQDNSFPSYDVPVDLVLFPASFYVDVNTDGKRDLLVSPNSTNISQNFESTYYYENNGTDQAPLFSFTSTNFIQGEMIDLWLWSLPCSFRL